MVMIGHISIQCDDIDASRNFYDAVLRPLGGQILIETGDVFGYGTTQPEFFLGRHVTGDGFRESHIAFGAPSRSAVEEFFAAAVSTGAEVLHEPRLWPEYHPAYFAAFVRDPDGNNVEAGCLTE